MNKKSLLKLQCVAVLALTAFSPVLSTVQNVYANETSSATAVSDQVLNTNFTSKSDQTALFRISKTGDQSLQIRKIEIVDAQTGESQRLFTESIISEDMTLRDGSIVGSIDTQKGRSYTIKIFYDKSDLKSKEATLTSAVLLKDGSTSSSAKRFNSKVDLDKMQDEDLATIKSKSAEIEKKIELEELYHISELEISAYDMVKDLSTGKFKTEDLKTYTDTQKKKILERVNQFSALDQSTKNRLQTLRDDLANVVFKNPDAKEDSIRTKLEAFVSEQEKSYKGTLIAEKSADPKTKEADPGFENKSDSSASQDTRTSSKPLPKPKEADSNKSDATSNSSDKKSSASDKNQSADAKNEPNRVAKSIDSKSSSQSQSSSKVDTSKLEEILKISKQLLARQVDTSNVSREGIEKLEQSKANLAERVERYKSLVKSEKADEKSVNVAIEDLRAAAGHYSLLLDLKSAVDSQNSSSVKRQSDDSRSKKDSKQSKDQSTDSKRSKDQSTDSKDSKDSKDQSKNPKDSRDSKDSKDQSKDLKDSKDQDLNKSDQSKSDKSKLDSKDKSQDQKSNESNAQGKTPRKFADTGEKDHLILSILGATGLASILGFIYKRSRKN